AVAQVARGPAAVLEHAGIDHRDEAQLVGPLRGRPRTAVARGEAEAQLRLRRVDAHQMQIALGPVLDAGPEGDPCREKRDHASAATVTLIFAVTSECSFTCTSCVPISFKGSGRWIRLRSTSYP